MTKLAALNAYLEIADKWHAFLQFGKKSAAAAVLREYGHTLSVENATRAKKFLEGVKDRKIVVPVLQELGAMERSASGFPDDDVIDRKVNENIAVVSLLSDAESDVTLRPLRATLGRALVESTVAESFVRGLEKSAPRAHALIERWFAGRAGILAELDCNAAKGRPSECFSRRSAHVIDTFGWDSRRRDSCDGRFKTVAARAIQCGEPHD
ncbi:MAG: hypothetical protein H7Z14_14345 [Anaerolineae bacterium]|nr:hypothetical protein [Phycisphaerae bacterium]